ncbi:hypothetical protein MIND_00931000 [Mycena indigotica]|uniref:F-box domain-containing protein n=1 Tax=Mycena indigotica TaxID=2126181 RepID=A0A8H6VX08_9AGAR|nr:uncharacterized protein MIND_00931000 [Mycena indigotica]KAF7296987.1 hypothetical protein MIND_00931000 [Mycena indigotica]
MSRRPGPVSRLLALPTELHLKILEETFFVPAPWPANLTLRRLALVCRRLHTIATPVLYREVDLRRASAVRSVHAVRCFLATIVAKPELGRFVRWLSLASAITTSPRKGVALLLRAQTLADWGEAFPQLRTLFFASYVTDGMAFLWDAHFPHLRRFCFHRELYSTAPAPVDDSTSSQLLMQFLARHAGSLRDVDLSALPLPRDSLADWKAVDAHVPTAIPVFTVLRRLEAPAFFFDLAGRLSLPALDELHIDWLPTARAQQPAGDGTLGDEDWHQAVLRKVADSLRGPTHLKIINKYSGTSPGLGEASETGRILSAVASSLPQTRFLGLCTAGNATIIDDASQALGRLHLPALQTLVFTFDSDDDTDTEDPRAQRVAACFRESKGLRALAALSDVVDCWVRAGTQAEVGRVSDDEFVAFVKENCGLDSVFISNFM